MKCFLLIFVIIFVVAGCGVNVAERNDYGVQRYFQGDMEGAVGAFQAAQVVEPDNPVVYFNMANALAQEGRLDEAAQALQLAADLGNDELAANAYFNLGNIYFDSALYNESIESYRESLRINPANDDARHNLQLAMSFLTLPTPTALEMQTEPEQAEADTSATPTDLPADEIEPSPTPTISPTPTPESAQAVPSLDPTLEPQAGDPSISGPIGGTFQPRFSSTSSVEEAMRLPDEFEQEGQQPDIPGAEFTEMPREEPEETLTYEEAEQLLEPFQHEMKRLGDFDPTGTPGIIPGGKDW